MTTTAQNIKDKIVKMIEELDALCGDYQFACSENTEEMANLKEEAVLSLEAIEDFIDGDVALKAAQ